jgi:hypothetical protein
LALILAVVPSFGQLTRHEEATLADAMLLAGVSEGDLGFDKKQDADPYRLPLNSLALDKPAAAIDSLMRLHEAGSGTLQEVLQSGIQATFGESAPASSSMTNVVALPANIPERLRQPIGYLVGCIGEADAAIRLALKDLNRDERREIIENLPQWAVGTTEIKLGFVSRPPSDRQRLFALLGKVDLASIRRASEVLAARIEGVLPEWRALSKTVSIKDPVRFIADGIKVEISGQGDDDHHALDTSLCIDLGGHNTYRGRYGAGVGYAGVLLDFGTSTFDVPDLSIGAGVLGIGLAYQLGGHCDYRGHSICFGSGIGGVGALYVDGGGNRIRSVSMGQGFGCFGVGLLLSTGGSDVFRADLYSQGAARTRGLGWQVAQRGNDFFRAGGLIPSQDGHYSFSQGYSAGDEKPFVSGGLGLLTSLGSDNTYVGERGCQGAAERGGIASFYDAGGNGSRTATSHAQGFADNQAAAFLFDIGGGDTFSLRKSTGQAFASRLSTCVALAREGHDAFIGGGSPATAVSGSVSILISDGPECSFAGYPGKALSNGVDSFALFCSVGGISRLLQESPVQMRAEPSGGVALQEVAPGGEEPMLPPDGGSPTPTPPGSPPNVKEIASRALSANVFIARIALIELLAIHDPTAPVTAAALLASPDPLVRRLAVRVFAQYPSEAIAQADALLLSSEQARTGIRLLGSLGTTQAMERIASHFDALPRDAQIEALEQMDGRVPASFIARLSDLGSSQDSLIRLLARDVYVNR